MIHTKKDLNKYLDKELRYKGIKGVIYKILNINEAAILDKHQILLRKCEYYTNNNCKILSKIYKFRLNRIQNKYAIHIPINCCDIGMKIMHLGPILINERVRIGKNCAIHVNTAIVAGGTNDKVPKIADNVVIGVGAVVLGGVVVANNVAIGANAVVNKDVLKEDVAVAGVPAKIVSEKGRTHWNKKSK